MDLNSIGTTRILQTLKDNPKGLTVSEVASKIEMHRNSVAKYLDILLISGQVEKRTLGPAKLFSLSKRVPFSGLINTTSSGVVIIDSMKRIVKANQKFSKSCEETEKSIMGKRIEDLQCKIINSPKVLFKIDEVLNGKDFTVDIDLMKEKEGYFIVKLIPLTFDDGTEGAGIFIDDITEKKKISLKIKESEERYRAIVEAFDGYIVVCSKDRKVEFMNNNLIKRTGKDRTGEPCYNVMHGRNSPCPWCINDKVFEGKTEKMELKSPLDNRWFYKVNTPLYNTDGTISKMALIIDITDQKMQEESYRQFRFAIDISADSIFIIDPDLMRFIDVNETAGKELGYEKENLLQIGPQDLDTQFSKESLIKEFKKIIREKDKTGVINTTYRKKDKKEIFLEIFLKSFESFDGRDIIVATARKTS